MFWSDATHLAQFGNASAWPIYLFFGNQSKYIQGCPNSGACHLEFKSPVQSGFFAFFGRKPDWTALGSLGMVPGPLKDRSKVVATGFSKNRSKTSPKLVKTAKKPVCFAFY